MTETAEPSIELDDDAPEYTAASLRLLEGREHMRLRPAMYIGDVGSSGLHYLFRAVLDTALDEAFAGSVANICVVLNADGSVSVQRDGPGMSDLEDTLTRLNWPHNSPSEAYMVTGLNMISPYATANFLSAWCEVRTWYEGRAYRIRYEKGLLTEPLQEIGATSEHGLTFTWLPDPEIFRDQRYSADLIKRYIRYMCYLTPEVTIRFHDRSSDSAPETYRFEHGVADLLASRNEQRETIGEIIAAREVRDDVLVDVALQFTESGTDTDHTFVNNIHTASGGSHLQGFQAGLKRAIGKCARSRGMAQGTRFGYADIAHGLTAVISIRHRSPRFEGATWARLDNPEVVEPVARVVDDVLTSYLDRNPEVADVVVERAIAARLRLSDE